MSADRILALKLIGDVSSINKSMKQTQGRMRGFASSAGSWMKAAGIGLAIEAVGKLGDALGDAWTGFREGEKAAAQLGTTWSNFNVKGADLADTIAEISAMTLKLGTDDTEAIKAFNTALQATGGSPTKAMDRLRIAQDLVANGSAPNLQSAMKLIQQAANGSARVVDRFGLKSKDAADRVAELGRKVAGAAKKAADADPIRVMLNGIGEGLERAVGALSKGDIEGALGGIRDAGTAISDAWTDVWPAVDKAMANLIGAEHWENAKAVVQGLLDKTAATFAALQLIWAGLAPHVQNALNLIAPLVAGIGAAVGGMAAVVSSLLDGIGALLNGDFTGAWKAVEGMIAGVVATVNGLITGMLGFLAGILPGIQTVATNIGNAIFGGIVGAVGGIVDTLKTIFENAVKAIRDVWNNIDFFLPDFVIPGIDKIVVPDPTGGSGFEVFGGIGPTTIWKGSDTDLIPDLAKGGVIRHSPGGTLARIGEAGRDEAVIPLDRMGGMGGNTYVININAPVGTDRAALGREVVDLIRAYERRDGKVWRTA